MANTDTGGDNGCIWGKGRRRAIAAGQMRPLRCGIVVLALLAGFGTASGAGAQAPSVFDQIFGGGTRYGGSDAPRAAQPEADKNNDLRADSTPWRSDVMVASIEKAIARYERIVANGGWPLVPGGRVMRPGEGDERLTILRKHLKVTGDLPAREGGIFDNYNFDGELEAAVRRYQARNGIRVSGRVDAPTFAALGVPAGQRLAQLKLNLQRVQALLNGRVEDRYVLVNVPAFELEAVERFEVQERHRVVAGRVERQTPEIKATIRALNFLPEWHVPESIAQLDLIPRLRKEPEYLEKEKIRAFNVNTNQELDVHSVDWNTADAQHVRFKQDSGPQDALGLLRIDMTNPEGVYMHDTPLKKLFDQRVRAFSAGCVRVQGVFALAEWIARQEPGWQEPGHVEETVNAGLPLELKLIHPVPVYFTYVTAWAETDGLVQFRADIYGRDTPTAVPGVEAPDTPPPPASLAP